jgi:1-acyl-sn-glycerol-3-phosphate acyltransferase
MTMNVRTLRLEATERRGGYVLACSHLSHVDPFCVSVLTRRKIDWMARIEFFRSRLAAAYLRTIDAFPVDRFGVPVRAVRAAIARAAAGRVVGIFPEGGVVSGQASVCRGGRIKLGACMVAQRADVPIIPCVILGTHRLNCVLPWVPYRRANLWIAFGEPVHPRRGANRRAARREMADELRGRFATLYREATEVFGIPDGEIP